MSFIRVLFIKRDKIKFAFYFKFLAVTCKRKKFVCILAVFFIFIFNTKAV